LAWTAEGGARRSPHDVGRALSIGRGAAILLVIFGHEASLWAIDAHGWFTYDAFLVWKLGAAFLMPLFFALSGMSWRAEKNLRATVREALTLIFMAWLASVAVDIVRVGLTLTNTADLLQQPQVAPLKLVKNAVRMLLFGDYYSVGALWFLPALGLTRLLGALAMRFGAVAAMIFSVALIGAGLAAQMFGINNYQQIHLLGVALTSFMIGHVTRGLLAVLVRHRWLSALVFVLTGVLTLWSYPLNQGCTFDFNRLCGFPFLNGQFGVIMIHGAFGNLALFTLTTLAGIAWGAGFSALVARVGGVFADRLALVGRNTLNILIVNALVLEFISPLAMVYVAPHLVAKGFWFFTAVLLTSWAVTLPLTALLAPVLHKLRAAARAIAVRIVSIRLPGWSRKRDRVSPSAHEPGSAI